jgi:UDP-N-acetylglucosamine/UDP-N-acetylgalactosamine diphosphorylase
MGLGAHVREGCILEEEANGAHCVGLKQTILFPFVTLGSLINFCDCLMAGGTSRKHHSEVGSSYIHFNFTPNGDKTTASLIGDVPRGVMLNQPPIFLGGQGGIVGPIRMGYGNVVAAGAILRRDYTKGNKLIVGKTYPGTVVDLMPNMYGGLSHILEKNIFYLANLTALEQWYIHVRHPFFNAQEFGDLIYAGALEKLLLSKKERIKRLKFMVDKIPVSHDKCTCKNQFQERKCELHDNIDQACALFEEKYSDNSTPKYRDLFLAAFENHKQDYDADYIKVIQSLPSSVSQEGVRWLDHIVERLCQKAAAVLPSLHLFKK